MHLEFFFFWLFLLSVCELCLSRASASYTFSLFVLVILTLIIFLFWKEYDLFASILLALYSSVFILLSLFLVYFNRYWGRAGSLTQGPASSFTGLVILVFAAAASCSFFFLDGYMALISCTFNLSYTWFFNIAACDYYLLLTNGESLTVVVMHAVLYQLYSLDVFFFNVYLLFGLILTVGFLFLLKITLNPATVVKLFATMRFNFFFAFPSNVRIRAANKFRRQTRRKNSSQVRYKV